MSTHTTSRLFRFGLFEADLENARLTRRGVRIRLQDQPFRILAMLLERSGQIIMRDELRHELWPAGTYVDFEGSLNAALKRLRAALDDDADNPRFIETVPKRGYRFIAPVKIEDAAQFVETKVSAPPAAPKTESAERERTRPIPSSLKSKRRLIFALAPATVLLAVSAFYIFHKRPPVSSSAVAPSAVDLGSIRRSVAVLGFQNASGRPEDAWLSTALTEMLRTELGAGGKLRVVPGENVVQFRQGAPWSQTDSLSRQTASRIGGALDSDLLVLGSYTTVGEPQDGSVRVDFRLQDAQTGEILYEGAESGSEKQLFGLVANVGVGLRERLGLPMISESEQVSVVSSLPSNPDANRFYSLGLQKLRDSDDASAKDLFLQAEKLAPRFPLVHLMLFRAWGDLGYDQNADDEIKTAYQLSSGLPEVEKLQIEGAYFQSLKKLDQAISAYRSLYTLYPDSVDYAEQLIIALNFSGRREEALAVVKQLRKLPAPASEDPRIDFWQAQLVADSDPPAAQPFLDKAIAEAASHGQKLLYARFRLAQCIRTVYGSHPQESLPYCQDAYEIFMAAGNRLHAADALRAMGDRSGGQGDYTGAREIYKRALAILIPLGEHEKTGVVLNNMAIAYENQGQIDEANKMFRQAAETWKECGDTYNEGIAVGNVADIFMAHGQLSEAQAQYESAEKLILTKDPSLNVSYELCGIAGIRLYQGDIAGAANYADRALAMSRSWKNSADIGTATSVIGDIRLAQGDLAGAREDYQQSLAIFQQLGNKHAIAQSQASLADVSIEEGRIPEAEQALRKSLAEFESQDNVPDEIRTEADLSRVLLREGKPGEARPIISDALSLARDSHDPSLKLPAAIQDARIEAAEIASRAKSKSDFSGPRRKLENVLATARQFGYYGIACDARLALGELELRANPASARAHLAALASEAHDHGLNLISRKAEALEASVPAK